MNAGTLDAKKRIDEFYSQFDDPTGSGGGNNGGTGGTGRTGGGNSGDSHIWEQEGFWGALNNFINGLSNIFGGNRPGAYPPYPQTNQNTINPLFIYGGGAIVLILVLALVYKIIK